MWKKQKKQWRKKISLFQSGVSKKKTSQSGSSVLTDNSFCLCRCWAVERIQHRGRCWSSVLFQERSPGKMLLRQIFIITVIWAARERLCLQKKLGVDECRWVTGMWWGLKGRGSRAWGPPCVLPPWEEKQSYLTSSALKPGSIWGDVGSGQSLEVWRMLSWVFFFFFSALSAELICFQWGSYQLEEGEPLPELHAYSWSSGGHFQGWCRAWTWAEFPPLGDQGWRLWSSGLEWSECKLQDQEKYPLGIKM